MTRIATRDPRFSRMCVLPDGSRQTIGQAESWGFTIVSPSAVASAPPTIAANLYAAPPTYLQTIAAMPEAASRPAAAAALGNAHDINTLSLTAAASLLRGLPIETSQDTNTMSDQHTLTAADYSNFQRKAELRCAGLTQSGYHGNEAARGEAKRIRSALHIVATTGVSYGAAFTAVGLDARATITAILS